ncbi:MAG: RNA 2',3'-cyclic phosphodiesterase [Nitrospiraceae bacterium]|nr:RNA 2',3'-cyclic phosphodiesterase [Nitrospiraceae bacterium]
MGIRCFIAIEIPEALRLAIGQAIWKLRSSGADVKWVDPGLIHITLKFLGDTEESRIGEAQRVLSQKVSHYAPFYIKIAGLDSFPSGRHPRVVWAGIAESTVLTALQKEIELGLADSGFPAEDRPFRPHLTIGRVKTGRRIADLVNSVRESGNIMFGDFEVRGVRLMKSELRPAGPVYTCLADIPLMGGNDVD